MALLFMDSFDHYVTADLTEKWTTASGGTTSISAGAGRRSSAAARITFASNGYLLKGVGASGATAIVGCAFRASALGGQQILGVYDAGVNATHVYLTVNSDGSLTAYRGSAIAGVANSGNVGTVLGSSAAGVLSANVYAYVELKVLLSDTVGTVTVRVNGLPVITRTAQDTAQGSLVWTAAWIGNVTSTISASLDFDDLYVCDGSGAAPCNDLLGDVRVDVRLPTAAGASTGWTPSAVVNWQNVDDATPNDDTDYNATTTLSATDTFVTQDAPVVGATIFGLQHCLNAKKMDTGTCTVAPVIRHGGVDYPGVHLAPSTAYAYALAIAAVNPATGAAWTEADFNAAEFGYQRTT
jgi:hypothetical protein